MTPFLVNLAIAAVFRAALPTTLAEGGERYLYYMMSLFFPYVGCPDFQYFRFLPPLLTSVLPLEVLDAFLVTGFLCQVLAGTLLWHVAERLHASRRVAFLTVCWYWAVWGPLPTLRDPLLIADPVQALWLIASLLLLLDGRYLLALPVLVSGAGVKESVLTVPVIYGAYLILSGEDIRRRIPWLAALIAAPIASWVIVRRVLMTVFQYASPGDAGYLSHPYLFGLWLRMLGPFPRNFVYAALYIFAGFGAAWIFGAVGLWRGDRRMRALSAATAPAMAFLALYQEPHRAVAAFPWAILIPAAAYLESLPLPLLAAVLVVNAAFTIRMSATVAWLPSASVLLAILILLVAGCLYLKRTSGGRERTAAGSPATAVRSGWYTALIPVALAVLMLAVVGYRFAMTRSVRETMLASPDSGAITADDSGTPGLVLSPDDTRIVFTGRGGGVGARRLWTSAIGSTTSEPIAGTEGATAPFWSPDGRAVGFFAGGQLKRLDVASREVRFLADAPESHGGTWSTRRTVLFAAGSETPIRRVAESGGPVTAATALDRSQPHSSHRWPQMLPDGEHFLFTEVGPALGEGAVRLGAIGSPESRLLLKDAYGAFYVTPGLVFFARENAVRVQPFDVRRLSIFPTDRPTSLPIGVSPAFSRAAATATARTIAFARPDAPRQNAAEPARARWFDRAGGPIDRVADPDAIGRVESPDGRQIAVTVRPIDTGPFEIHAQPAAGGGAGRTIVTNLQAASTATSWSPDGRVVLYQTIYGEIGVWAAPIDGGAPVRLFRDALRAAQAQFSPDGRWIAYSAVDERRGGVRTVYVEPYPPTGDRWIVSPDGGGQPRWRADGREIVFVVENRFLLAAAVDTRNGFHVDGPRRLFETRVARAVDERYQYAMTPDGQRFLVNTVTSPEPTARVTVMTNWMRALKLTDQ